MAPTSLAYSSCAPASTAGRYPLTWESGLSAGPPDPAPDLGKAGGQSGPQGRPTLAASAGEQEEEMWVNPPPPGQPRLGEQGVRHVG